MRIFSAAASVLRRIHSCYSHLIGGDEDASCRRFGIATELSVVAALRFVLQKVLVSRCFMWYNRVWHIQTFLSPLRRCNGFCLRRLHLRGDDNGYPCHHFGDATELFQSLVYRDSFRQLLFISLSVPPCPSHHIVPGSCCSVLWPWSMHSLLTLCVTICCISVSSLVSLLMLTSSHTLTIQVIRWSERRQPCASKPTCVPLL
ncbi:hypothetical protein IW261DRAFT_1527177 [Armillaria novae-zelandiae]|uniref:Uncharacterized protein n=1 Tax=Armillaria novae-zelandiae TaxID=153914 RepID=A0AA39NBX9_9AGAR|nr:hypothetical protein IW261DRAFT_1527177 [Armillaria novae-zelandiae]